MYNLFPVKCDADTPIKRTAAKSPAKTNYRRLTEINSRYYRLSLKRTLTPRFPTVSTLKGVHFNWEWQNIALASSPYVLVGKRMETITGRINDVFTNIKRLQLLTPYLSVGAAWPSGYSAGLGIRRPSVQVSPWPLTRFVLGSPEFNFSAMLVN